jgi:hypothetical protein
MNTNKVINDLDLIPVIDVNNDFLPIVDVTDGKAKRVSLSSLGAVIPVSASNITSGTLADARLSTNVTLKGNTFNGADDLVELDASGHLPAVNGSALTNLNASSISSGTLADARLSSSVTIQGNTFNGPNQLVKLNASSILPACSGINLTDLNANNINAGTVANARLSSSVTLQGNSFNGVNQLVQLDGSSQLPNVSGANLTDLNASEINSGSLSDSVLSPNVALKTKQIVALPSPTVQTLSDLNKDAIFVVGHGAGLVNFNLPNSPITSTGVSFTIITNTVQAISFTCDTLVTAHYINAGGTGTTLASGATLSPGNQIGRVITVTCINTNTYVISGAAL